MQGLGGKSNVAEAIKMGEVVRTSKILTLVRRLRPSEFAFQVTHVLDLLP